MSTPETQLSPEAREKLEAWAPAARALLGELLEDAGSDLQREFLDRAIAAGHSSVEVHAFADELRGMDDDAAFDACTLDADAPEGYTVNQLLRAEADPLYAFELKGGSLSPAEEGGEDTPVTTELPLDEDELLPEKTPPRPQPQFGSPGVAAPRSPAVAPAPAPAAVVPSRELVGSGTTPSGTLRPMLAKDLAAGTGSQPSLKPLQAKDLAAGLPPSGVQKMLSGKDLAAGVPPSGPQKAMAGKDVAAPTQPQPALPTIQAKDLVASTQPQASYKPAPKDSAATQPQAAYKPMQAKDLAAATQPHPAFRPETSPASAAAPLKPMQAKDIIGSGMTPSGTQRPSLREAAGSGATPSGTSRSREVSSGGLPMAGLPMAIAGKLASRDLGGAADPMRSRSPATSGSPPLAPGVANKLMEDSLSEASRPFGFGYRELDVDGEGGTTLEQALEQAAAALQRGVVVPVTLGPSPGQHRRFAVLMQLSVVGKNRAWQLYELVSQELVWANEGDLLARSELPFSNKANRRITRFALPNLRASDF